MEPTKKKDVSVVHFKEAVLIKGAMVNSLDCARHGATVEMASQGVHVEHKGKLLFVPFHNVKSVEFIV
jgi:hypothetical protein